jgi:hypothetical protein
MGNVQKHNNCINIPSSQTSRSYLQVLEIKLIIARAYIDTYIVTLRGAYLVI